MELELECESLIKYFFSFLSTVFIKMRWMKKKMQKAKAKNNVIFKFGNVFFLKSKIQCHSELDASRGVLLESFLANSYPTKVMADPGTVYTKRGVKPRQSPRRPSVLAILPRIFQ